MTLLLTSFRGFFCFIYSGMLRRKLKVSVTEYLSSLAQGDEFLIYINQYF